MSFFYSKKFANSLLKLAVTVCSLTCVVVAFTYAKYYSTINDDYNNDEGLPGNVGLRSYFHTGTGTSADPFVITRPIHFYNLTRLQNLGIFDPLNNNGGRYYFRVGYDLDNADADNDVTTGLDVYTADTGTTVTDSLDMSGDNYATNLLSIGSESTPFYGSYDGSSIPITGLKIHSSPEDIGVFGYTGSGSLVKNCVFSNLSIYDDGYDTNGLGDLYTTNVDTSALVFADTNGKSLTVNKDNPLGSVVYEVGENNFSTFIDGTFTPTFPTLPDGCTTVTRSSSTLVLKNISTDKTTIVSDADVLKSTDHTFITKENTEVDFRVSLIAQKTLQNTIYSKVLSTFLIKFIHKLNASSVDTITMEIYRDYVSSTESDDCTQYAHGTNIGYLIGHADGSVQDCYVYNGATYNATDNTYANDTTNNGGLYINSGDSTTNTAMNTESSIGLIGEVGVNIDNEFSPTDQYEKTGDTGVVNFTGIYNSIRGGVSDTQIDNIIADGNSVNAYSYTPISGNLYDSYLRRDANYLGTGGAYITNGSNSVDFFGQQIIGDDTENNIDRGLGIFTLSSSSNNNYIGDIDHYASEYSDGFGSYKITNTPTTTDKFTEFYYTTAEYVPTNTTTNEPSVVSYWGNSSSYIGSDGNGNQMYYLENQVDMPSYADSSTWSSRYEKKNNYIIRCPLEASSAIDGNYFYNTNSDLLKEYFTYKLRDKRGHTIAPTNKDFGVSIKTVNDGAESNIETFDSYLTINKPSTFVLNTDSGGNTYAASSISFKISNVNGANVTVLASNFGDCGNYLSIYKKDQVFGETTMDPKMALYSTYIPSNTSDVDGFSYFDYDSSTGTTSSQATITSGSSNRLFAHTFFIKEPGEYFISSPGDSSNNKKAIRVYYVAAQGQKNGNTGENDMIQIDTDTIANLDFLLYDPKDTNYELTVKKAGIYTEVYFTNSSNLTGTFQVYANTDHKLHIRYEDTHLTTATIYNKNYLTASYYFGYSDASEVEIANKQFYFYPN